jgi:oligopeptide/dipeptide ABC transporter ATP-binding protein
VIITAQQQALQIRKLVKYYNLRRSIADRLLGREVLKVRAVDDVTFDIGYNETLGLVGESGSGKTTLGRTILRLEKPTSGQLTLFGEDITKFEGRALRKTRRDMQIVFQNPTTSLDPRQRVRDILSEPLQAFHEAEGGNVEETTKALEAVGLPSEALSRFPHEFSGGQRQRISIARALMLNPRFLVLDEPTSALDSSVQAQILNLLRRLQEDRKLTYLFITHNVSVVRYMADRIAVMYSGKIVEIGNTREIMERPFHPYTIALISSIPEPDPEKKVAPKRLVGEVQSAIHVPSGCRFHPRCPYVQTECREAEPELRQIQPGHWAACHFAERLSDEVYKPIETNLTNGS